MKETLQSFKDIGIVNRETGISASFGVVGINKKKDVSNCPLCASGDDSNKRRVWKYAEMDADHVTAWSKGGKTDAKNCQMLCKTHNRAKGNR